MVHTGPMFNAQSDSGGHVQLKHLLSKDVARPIHVEDLEVQEVVLLGSFILLLLRVSQLILQWYKPQRLQRLFL